MIHSMVSCLRLAADVTCGRHLGPVLDRQILNRYTINLKYKCRNRFRRFKLSTFPILEHFVHAFDAIFRRRTNEYTQHTGFVYLPYKGRTNLCDIGIDHMICLFHIWVM